MRGLLGRGALLGEVFPASSSAAAHEASIQVSRLAAVCVSGNLGMARARAIRDAADL